MKSRCCWLCSSFVVSFSCTHVVISSFYARFVVSSYVRFVSFFYTRFVVCFYASFVISSCARFVVSSFARFVVISYARFVVISSTRFVDLFYAQSSSDSSHIFNSHMIQTSLVKWVFTLLFKKPQPGRASLSIADSGLVAQENYRKWLFNTALINSRLLARNHATKEVDLSFEKCEYPTPVKRKQL